MIRHLTCLAVIIALAACGNEPKPAKVAAVTTEGDRAILSEPDKADFLKSAIVEKDQGSTLRLPGRLVWNEDHTVRVVPQLAGRIQKITVEIGSEVKAGQILATLSSPDYGQAQADARKAQADQQLAKHALERQRELHAAGIVADKDFQQTEAEATRARAEADRASRRLAGLGGASDGSYILRSPLAGIVVERNLNPGLEFRPEQSSDPLFVVTDPTSLWLRLDASEADLAALKAGEKIASRSRIPERTICRRNQACRRFRRPGHPHHQGSRRRTEPGSPAEGRHVRHGLIELPPTKPCWYPPRGISGDEQHYLFVEEATGRYLRAVQTGPERDGRIEILTGVNEGEKVVIEGNLILIRGLQDASRPAEATANDEAHRPLRAAPAAVHPARDRAVHRRRRHAFKACRSRRSPTSPTPRSPSSRSSRGARRKRSRSRSRSRSRWRWPACPNSIRMFSHTQFGLSFIILTFDDKAEPVLRAPAGRRAPARRSTCRPGVAAELAPLATPIGEVYRYRLQAPGLEPRELRTLQDWAVERQLQAGARRRRRRPLGGLIKQYEVSPDLAKLRDYKVTLQQLFGALAAATPTPAAATSSTGPPAVPDPRHRSAALGRRDRQHRGRRAQRHARAGAHVADVTIGRVPRQGIVGRTTTTTSSPASC